MDYIKNYYENYDEDNRLTSKHGRVEYVTTQKYIHECISAISAKDLEKNLNFTGSTAYYHVTMMLKANMLKTRFSGRTVFYSLNHKYFEGILAQIVPLSEGDTL